MKTKVRKRRSTREVRDLLVKAARDVFSRQGYAGASTRQIADRARVTEVLIFRQFGGKRGLFEAAVVEPFSKILSDWVDQVADHAAAESDEELVREFISILYELMLENRDLVLALVAAVAHDEHLEKGIGKEVLTEGFSKVARFAREQSVRRGVAFDARLSARVAVSMVLGMALLDPWLYRDTARRPRSARIVEEMVQFMTYGVTRHS